ncbi:hypothetical protein [Burkholderia cepacia]|nr:hypothetical protein [Burkholderia cepacia]
MLRRGQVSFSQGVPSRERDAFAQQEFYAQTGLLAGEAVQH